jgi:hypothetical protein
MTVQFLTYAAIILAVWFTVALVMVKPRNVVDLSRCVGWYLLVMLATYLVRPAMSEVMNDNFMYQWLRTGNFEDHWHLMAIAVPLALVSFGIGYAAGGPPQAGNSSQVSPDEEPSIDPRKVRKLIYFFLFLGYISLIISVKTNTFSGEAGDYEGATVGVYEHNTAWFAQDDLFISSAGILYFITTGELGMSLALTAPWIMFRIVYGWGRSFLLGHFFALMAVYFLRVRRKKLAGTKNQTITLGLALVVVLVLFPLMGMLRILKGQLHMSSAAVSQDALSMVGNEADPQEMLQTYLGTNSSITGFETTLAHLLNDHRSAMGTTYLYYYLFEPIPRIIWPGKGTPYTWPQDLRGVESDPLMAVIGAAPGSVGMAYQQWGWLGIPFEFILTGLILRKAEEAVRRRPNVLYLQFGYAGLYSMMPQLGRDSLFYMIPNAWEFRFGIPVFILWIMYKGAVEQNRRRRMAVSAPVPALTIAPARQT